MAKITIDKPFLPNSIEVETDIQLRDASIRQAAGILINLIWESPDGNELGTRLFICEHCLRNTAGFYHDKKCLFAIVEKALKKD